jgi:ABC-type sugar transport system ATPase subunit
MTSVATCVDRRLLLSTQSLRKAFGQTKALTDCTFRLAAGEVHAIAGENGSGKSTLVKILSGVHQPDSGDIDSDGTAVRGFRSPRASQERGIVTVFQEILVAPARSVLDNIWLGAETPIRAGISSAEKKATASMWVERLLGTSIDLSMPAEDLSLSDRQACCIARALVRNPRVLILDEATSALDVGTRDRLFEIVRELAARGTGVVLITHRMDEIEAIGDRITVMRSGATVGTFERGDWRPSQVVALMSGTGEREQRERARDRARHLGPVLLRAKQLRLRAGGEPFDVEIRAGELVGLAGLEGHGQEAFLEALRGTGPARGDVERIIGEKTSPIRSISDASKNGVAYVPRERGRESMFGWMSIRENFGMPTLDKDTVGGWLRPASTSRRLDHYVRRMGIVLGDPEDRITTLSGGNAQKVVIARWLAAEPKVLLLNDPTRGIDVNAKRDLYELLTTLVTAGLAVVMLSTDVDEHVDLMDRVLVFREGELYREMPAAELSRSALVSAYFADPEEMQGGARS